MTAPRASLSKLTKLHVWEYAVRFLFGGIVTAAAGWISQRYGFAVGGMFLAFPAILPASLTLVRQHDGRSKALDDARGGRVGAVALAWFALIVALAARSWPAVAFLSVALCTWTVVAVVLWRILLARR
jgi:hypothetical protein